MCNIGAVGLGLQGAGMVGSSIAGMIEDRTNREYSNYRNQLINSNYARQTQQLNNSYAQEQLTNASQRQQAILRNMQLRASAQAKMASLGISGNTIDNLYRGYDRAMAMNDYLSARDLEMKGLAYNDKLGDLGYARLNTFNQYSYQQKRNYQNRVSSTLFKGIRGLSDSMLNLYKANERMKEQNEKYL